MIVEDDTHSPLQDHKYIEYFSRGFDTVVPVSDTDRVSDVRTRQGRTE